MQKMRKRNCLSQEKSTPQQSINPQSKRSGVVNKCLYGGILQCMMISTQPKACNSIKMDRAVVPKK